MFMRNRRLASSVPFFAGKYFQVFYADNQRHHQTHTIIFIYGLALIFAAMAIAFFI